MSDQGGFEPPQSGELIEDGKPAKPKTTKKQTAMGCGCLTLLAVIIVVVLVNVFGGGSPQSKAAASSSVPASPGTGALLAPTSHTLAPVADRNAAYTILTASVAHYRQVFAQGRQVIGTTQYPDGQTGLAAMDDPTSAAARFRDWRASTKIEQDLSSQTAFAQADKNFTADNEPPSISTWQDDMGNLSSDIIKWVDVATSYQISSASQADLDQAAAKVTADLTKANADAAAVQDGK